MLELETLKKTFCLIHRYDTGGFRCVDCGYIRDIRIPYQDKQIK